MNGHAALNRIYRLVWSDHLQAWVAVAETARGRGKRSSVIGAALFVSALAAWAGPPQPNALPTGGKVVAGQATIGQSGARMDVNQSSQRAVIDWNTYNVGTSGHVNYQQPNAQSVTLNRVQDTQASQILGRITANGQVFLVNPNGVYFGRSASVDVGGLVASTKPIGVDDFMAGRSTFSRNGSTGAVVNEGELRAALGGYIALLAPEVRNEGVIVARLGTVAMASGDSVTLRFDGARLGGIIVEPSKIKALVENKGAVIAPGGVVVLSAQSLEQLQGGVVRNTGRIEATGMAMRGGRIVLEASSQVDNSGAVRADAGADGSPAGQVSVSAPTVVNSGVIAAAAPAPALAAPVAPTEAPLPAGGQVEIRADRFVQAPAGTLDVSAAAQAGSVQVRAAERVDLAGVVDARSAQGGGGAIDIASGGNVTADAARLDASGDTAGGRVRLEAGAPSLRALHPPQVTSSPAAPAAPGEPQRPNELPTLALLGETQVRSGSRRGKGGSVTLTGDQVGMFDTSLVDASGAAGGGHVRVGGGFQGQDPAVRNAQATFVAAGATVRADATESGAGGDVVVWADGVTRFLGHASARGGDSGGDGGNAEVSGKSHLDFRGTVDLRAPAGATGALLLDPGDLTIADTSSSNVSGSSPFQPSSGGSVLDVNVLQAALVSSSVTVQTTDDGHAGNGDLTVAADIGWFSNQSLTLSAYRNLAINADITGVKGSLVLTSGTGGAGQLSLAANHAIALYNGNLTARAGSDLVLGVDPATSKLVVKGTSSFTAGGAVVVANTQNELSGAISATSGAIGSVTLRNNQATTLGQVSAGTGGLSVTVNGHLSGSSAISSLGKADIRTEAGSAGSINLAGNFSADGAVTLATDGAGGIAIRQLRGAVTFASVSAGGAITLGDAGTGALTFDADGAAGTAVVAGNAGPGGQASGVLTVTGASITLRDAIRTKGGNVSLTSTVAAVEATDAGAAITTTADANTGTASGTVTVTGASGVRLKDIVTTGADNNAGVGSNAAAVTLQATTGDVRARAITTSGGAATKGSTTNRNGGNAGNIVLGTGDGKIYLDGDLNAIGGSFVGTATQGLGGYVEVQSPTVITGDRLISTGATSGDINFRSTIDSDGTARSLTLEGGAAAVTLHRAVGGNSPLASLAVKSATSAAIEGNVTTTGAGGVSVKADTLSLGDDGAPEGGGITIDTSAGNGTVTFDPSTASNGTVRLDDAVSFKRGTGAIRFQGDLVSKAGERNALGFSGANGGAISVGRDVGGGSASASTRLGDITIDSVTDLTFGRDVSAAGLKSLGGTGRVELGSGSTTQWFDGAQGFQVATTGTANVVAGDENITISSAVVVSHPSAPISVSAPNGSATLNGNLTTAGGAITLTSGAGVLRLGGSASVTSKGGAITLSGHGVRQDSDSTTGAVVDAGSGKIRIDAAGQEVKLYTALATTDADSPEGGVASPAVLVTRASDVALRTVKAASGTLQIGVVPDASAGVAGDPITGQLVQVLSSQSDRFDLHTLSVAATSDIRITSTSNVIDQLGNFTVGGVLDVRASGRTSGLALSGDVSATAVTIKTGAGALSLGSRSVTATVGDVFLQGVGLTQSAGSTIRSAGRVTIYGSDYAQGTRGNVTLEGGIVAADTSSSAVVIDDTLNLQLGEITIGKEGARGGLFLGTYNELANNSGDPLGRRGYVTGTLSQTAGTTLKVGSLTAFQTEGTFTLANAGNEIRELGFIARGGALAIRDTDAEANGLAITSDIHWGSQDTLVRIGTGGKLNVTGGVIVGKGVHLSSGAGGITTTSNDIQAQAGGGADLVLDGGGGDVLLGGRLYQNSATANIVIQNARDVRLHDVELRDKAKLVLGGAQTETKTALTGNVTQDGTLAAFGGAVNLTGNVAGAVRLDGENRLYGVGDFRADGGFTLVNQEHDLAIGGALTSASGSIDVRTLDTSLTVTATGSVSAPAAGKSVTLRAGTQEWDQTLTVQGSISAGSGGVTLASDKGFLATGGLGAITSSGVVKLQSAPDYVDGKTTDYSTSVQAAITGDAGIVIESGGSFATSGAGTLTSSGGSVSIRTHWDGTHRRDLTLAADVTAGMDGIRLTSAGAITQEGGVLATPGSVSGPNQGGGLDLGNDAPSARGAVTLTGANRIGGIGPFYVLDPKAGAITVNDTDGGLVLTGTVESSHGAVSLSTAGGALDLATFSVYAGGQASGGATISLTGRGIRQSQGSISATGGVLGSPRTGANGGGKLLLTGHDGTASGAVELSGTLETANGDETPAIRIRGTTDLVLPNVVARNGALAIGDDEPTVGAVTGNVSQADGTKIDIKELRLGTATTPIGGSAVLANSGNAIVQLGGLYVGDAAGTRYDLDVLDGSGGLTVNGTVSSVGGVRIRTAKGEAATGALALGSQTVQAGGDIFLSGASVTQDASSVVDADRYGAAATGGQIRVDGGGGTNALDLSGTLRTDNAGAAAIQIVNAKDVSLNIVSAPQGTVSLGLAAGSDGVGSPALPLTGAVTQADPGTSNVRARTLTINAGQVTLTATAIDRLGPVTTTGALQLTDNGGAGTAGLKLVGDVVVGAASSIETTDGALDLDTFGINATRFDLVLKGVGVRQGEGSSIRSTTAENLRRQGSIDLFSALNDFTGQVTVDTTGDSVNLRDANQLSMNSLTGNLAPTTSFKAWAGTQLVLTPEDLTTTTGSIELRSLTGNLATPGKLTTGSGNITLSAGKLLTQSNSLESTSGNLSMEADVIASVAGAGYHVQTGGAGTIDVTARTGDFTQGLDMPFSTHAGDITLRAPSGNVNLANVHSDSGALRVEAGGNVQQQNTTAVTVGTVDVTTRKDGGGYIDLTAAGNDASSVRLRSLNADGTASAAGTITYQDTSGFAVREVRTTGTATLTAHGAIATDTSSGATGAVQASALVVKTLADAGADIALTSTANDVSTLDARVLSGKGDRVAGSIGEEPADGGPGTIRFTDANGFVVAGVQTRASTVLTGGAAADGGSVTQTGAIVSARLGLAGSASFTLNGASNGTPVNQFTTFASSATGNVDVSSQQAVTIGQVNPTGVTTGGASFALMAPSITVTEAIDTRGTLHGGSVTLTTTGTGSNGNLVTSGNGSIDTSGRAGTGASGGDAGNIVLTAGGDRLSIGAAITARGGAGGTLRLEAATGAVQQAGAAPAISVDKVRVLARDASALASLANDSRWLAARITGDGQSFTYRSAGDFSVGGGDPGIVGITTQGGMVDLSNSAVSISLAESVTTRGGEFRALFVGAFDSLSGYARISTAGDITYAGGAFKNGGAVTIATSGELLAGPIVTDGSADAARADGGAVTLMSTAGAVETRAIQTRGVGAGVGGAVVIRGATEARLGGDIDTSGGTAGGGSIDLHGPTFVNQDGLRLSTGSGGGDITFHGTLDGHVLPRTLTLSAGGGDVRFAGAVGSIDPLVAIAIESARDVRTEGSLAVDTFQQDAGTGTTTFGGSVSLGNLRFTGNELAIEGPVRVSNNAIVTNAGTFSTAAGTTIQTGTGFLQNGTGANRLGGDITADAGGITFTTGVTLTGPVAMQAGGTIEFKSTVDGDGEEARNLKLTGADVTFDAIVGGSQALGDLQVDATGRTLLSKTVTAGSVTTGPTGVVAIAGGSVTTSGKQAYGNAVELGADTVLTGSQVSTAGTVVGQGMALKIVGDAVFGDESADSVTGLAKLDVTGKTVVNTATITSRGTQTYAGAVVLGADTTLTTTDAAVRFESTVDSAAGGHKSLAVSAGRGDVVLGGAIGLTDTDKAGDGALGDLRVDSAGLTQLKGAVLAASVTTDAPGQLRIDGGAVTTSGTQTYGENAVLGQTTRLAGTAVTFRGSVDAAAAGAQGLDIEGDASFGAVGGSQALRHLSVTGFADLSSDVTTTSGAGGTGDQTYARWACARTCGSRAPAARSRSGH